jgi:Fe-S cluster assembly protein SufD
MDTIEVDAPDVPRPSIVAGPSHASALPFIRRYRGIADGLPGEAAARTHAATILEQNGFPGVREEAWKYTNLRPLGELSFHGALTEAGGLDSGASTVALQLPDLGTLDSLPRLVFVQGRLREDLSVRSDLLSLGSFAKRPQFGDLANPARERMVALNAMLTEDGAIIDVGPGIDAGTLLLVSLGGDIHGTPIAFHPRHAIRLGEGAKLTLIEIATGLGVYLHNPVSEIHVAGGASLTHVRLQDESTSAFHLATIYADIGAGAIYDSFTLTTGGRLARCEIHARLSGRDAHVAVNAAQLLRGTQHGDFTTIVSHDAPNGASRQTVKNVLADRSRGVFQGKIEVARDAQKTDGYQMNQALLLSPHAEIDCKPQLEIYADDVKCSHGATVGALDAEQLFYLVSRGIPKAEAEAMLVKAFLVESLDMIPHGGARALLDGVLQRWWSV